MKVLYLKLIAFQFVFVIASYQAVLAQSVNTCRAVLYQDTLTIENQYIGRKFLWNGGNLITLNVSDKKRNITWNWMSKDPDAKLPGHGKVEGKGALKINTIAGQPNQSDHLDVIVTAQMGLLEVKRIFSIYPAAATLTCTFYLRGKASKEWEQATSKTNAAADFNSIEAKKNLNTADSGFPVMDKLSFAGNHWQLRPIEFFDVTDRNNTLVKESSYNLYRLPGYLTGNLLFMKDLTSGYSFFVLKEAPCANLQLANPGFDFQVKNNAIQTVGMGILPSDVNEKEWVRGYGYTFGLGENTELQTLQNLRNYQDAKHPRISGRDEMIMMNTWGDRNKDAKLSEKFILDELKKAAQLGITHYQIDDGWQLGRSVNSSVPGGNSNKIYQTDNYWTPNPIRFPNGFAPIMLEAKKLGLSISLWFSPNTDDHYKYWEKDAETLIRLYREYSISIIKIDFVQIEDKTSEMNFRKLLDSAQKSTNYKIAFNLDVTAGRRNGYHFFNEYGNLWLENRYTDWANYYPYWTLRNLWDLSKYIPAQNLQISFLNKWRNADKYPIDDPFAPSKYSFDYLFAITLMAQPMAFFEATGLPDEAFSTSRLIKTYTDNRAKIHQGQIFPIGSEPDGRVWTGFQSINNQREGYILVFREDNGDATQAVKTWLPARSEVVFSSVAGECKTFSSTVQQNGMVTFTLPSKNSFGLFKYALKKKQN
jgi:alpha-galactosidase